LTISDTPLSRPASPLSGRYIINEFFLPFPDKKIGRFLTISGTPLSTLPAPYQGVILSIQFFHLFPTKKSVDFRPYLLVHILQ